MPGGIFGTVILGLPPLALIIAAIVRNRAELVGDTNELTIGAAIVAAGIAMYFLSNVVQRRKPA